MQKIVTQNSQYGLHLSSLADLCYICHPKHDRFFFMATRYTSPTTKPLIFVTNDDGIEAKGLRLLAEYLAPLGEIVTVAPDGPRSGQSAAITAGIPLRVTETTCIPGCKAYKTNGTPVDCVKLSMNNILDRRPDLLVSGINHGSNSGVSVIYSGTMGAVFEGVIQGIPSVGFSLCDHDRNADFTICRPLIVSLCQAILEKGLPSGIGLNVNFPAVKELKGAHVCRAARGLWTEEYDRRIDPFGRPYYWLTGTFRNAEPDSTDTDEYFLAHDMASIVPVSIDRTDYDVIKQIQDLSPLLDR